MSEHARQTSIPVPATRPVHRPTQGAGVGNAFLAEQMQAQMSVARPRPRPTPEQRFEDKFAAQKDRIIEPGENFWKQLSEEEAAALAASEDPAAEAGQVGYHTSVNDETWQWGPQSELEVLMASDMMGDEPRAFSRAFVTENATDAEREDVTILGADGTVQVQQGNESGMVELPESGHGFGTHNRDDVRMNGVPQGDQWGDPESIARTVNIMSDYGTLFPDSSLSIGDLSTDGGGSPRLYDDRNTRHKTHYNGSQMDLRYPHGTSSRNSISSDNADDMFRLRSLIDLSEDRGIDNFHAATGIRNSALGVNDDSSIHFSQPHNNHLHMGQGNGKR